MKHSKTMSKILLSLLLLFLPALLAAEPESRMWEAGTLTWEEFKGVPALPDAPANLAADIVMSTTGDTEGDFCVMSAAVVYPERSYASPEARTPLMLRYMQARFDLAEIMSRRLQRELAAGINGIEADRRLAYYRNLCRTESDKMAADTRHGTADRALQMWEYDIRRALEETEKAVPGSVSLVLSPWSYGLYVGVGGVFPTGSLSDAFSGGCAFTFGLQGGWRRFRLEGLISYSIPTLRDQALVTPGYEGQGYRANVRNANYLGIGFGAGYAVYDSKRITIAPYVGGMWTGYNWTARPMAPDADGNLSVTGLQQRMEIDDFNVAFGVNIEWHFHSAVTSFPLFGNMREHYVSSLRLTPYAVRGVYTDAVRHYSGWQIGFMVSYSGVARALGIR